MADMIVSGASAQEIETYYQGKYSKALLIEGAYEAEDFFPGLNKNGRWLHFTASPLISNDGTMMGAIETLEDITERKELENNLHHYLQQITRAQEEERKHIARELHDDMAQILGSSSRQLDNLLRTQHTFTPAQASDLKDIQEQLNQGLKFVQRFIQDLRPSLLDDLGLVPALRSLTNSLENTDGVITIFTVRGKEKRLTTESELSLFRILQEALNNVRKHAEASEVQVITEFYESGIRLMVRDDGRGFKVPRNIESLPGNSKLGLMGIQERVWLLGGSLEINSEPGKGTTLLIDIPAINGMLEETH
jgi:signal transduction histidine kinase